MIAALAALCFALGAAAPQVAVRVEAHPKRFSSSLDKQKISLGEPFTLTIEVVHAAQDAWSLPQPLQIGELTAREKPQIARRADGADAVTTFTLPLVDLKTLNPKVPDLTLMVDGPEGPRTFTVPGQKLGFISLVEPEGKPNKEKGPRAPKRAVPIFVRSHLWVGVLLGTIAFAALLYAAAILGKRAREARALRNIPPPLEPAEEALQRIADLRSRAPWKTGAARASIFELSEIVRLYLGKRLGFGALDLTSDELIGELKRRRILGLDLAELTEEMSWENLVKFAKVEPTAEECEEALARAAELIERTRPMHAAPPAEARP